MIAALTLLLATLAADATVLPPNLEAGTVAAEAAMRAGDYKGAALRYREVVEELETHPATAASGSAWSGALLQVAVAEATLGNLEGSRAALERVLAIEPSIQVDPELYSPAFRRELEAARTRVAARPRHLLRLDSVGGGGQGWVPGRPLGPLPTEVELPAGSYRVGVESEGRTRVVTVELSGDRTLLLDPPAAGLSAPPPAPPAPAPGSWMRPVGWTAGGLALVAAGIATWQGISASSSYAEATGMLQPDGTLKPGVDPSAYSAASSAYDRERRNAWIAGGSALVLGAGAAVLLLIAPSAPVSPAPGGLALRF